MLPRLGVELGVTDRIDGVLAEAEREAVSFFTILLIIECVRKCLIVIQHSFS